MVELLEAVEANRPKRFDRVQRYFNTFEHVIATLIHVSSIRQSKPNNAPGSFTIKEKCTVKHGSYDRIEPMCEAICEAGIDARILNEYPSNLLKMLSTKFQNFPGIGKKTALRWCCIL